MRSAAVRVVLVALVVALVASVLALGLAVRAAPALADVSCGSFTSPTGALEADPTGQGGPGKTGSYSVSAGGLSSMSATFNWGDGTVQSTSLSSGGSYTFSHVYTLAGSYPTLLTVSGVLGDGTTPCSNSVSGTATITAPPGSVQVPQPAPGATVDAYQVGYLSALASSDSFIALSSSGNFGGDDIVAQGDVQTRKQLANGLGDLVAWCWLTLDFHDANGNVIDASPAQQFAACTVLMRSLVFGGKPYGATVASPNALAVQSGVVLSSAAGRGCRELAIPIDVRTKKGKIVSIGKAKHATLRSSAVHYSCSVSGGAVKITIKGHKSLRTSLGKRLHLMVLRAKKAPPVSGTLTFTFGR